MSGATTKKMLQGIKEIVGANFSDDEIYFMLKECNMDPSEAVHRLLNQDSFQEVKSKREKKKDSVKETSESRSRTISSSNRGSKGVSDRGNRASSAHINASTNHSKPSAKRENGLNATLTSPVSVLGGAVAAAPKSLTSQSDAVIVEMAGPSVRAPDPSPQQYPVGVHQNAWGGMSGHRTLADIVKMGRPLAKTGRSAPQAAGVTNSDAASVGVVAAPASHQLGSSGSLFKAPESHTDSSRLFVRDDSLGQHLSHNDWLLVDQPHAGASPLLESHGPPSGAYADVPATSNLPVESIDLRHGFQLNEGKASLDCAVHGEDTDRQQHLDSSSRDPSLELGSAEEANFEHEEDVAASNLQRLSLEEDAPSKQQTDDHPAVIIPNHLQVANADCSYLSFGTFGSGGNANFPGTFVSKAQNNSNLEAPRESSEPASVQIEENTDDARNSDYYTDEHLGVSMRDNAESNRASTKVENYDPSPSSSSQPEGSRSDGAEAMDGLPYRMQSSTSGYPFSSAPEPAAAPSYDSVPGNSSLQNLAPFSNVMQAYPGSLPGNLLSSGVPQQEYDLPHSSLLAAQSMPTKYSTAMSTISGPTVSMPETTVKPVGSLSSAPQAMQSLPVTSVPSGGAAVPLHLPPVAQYSQPTLPLGHFANMIGYPFLQSYTYMPSAAAAFQQALAGSATYHQSPVAALHAAGLKYSLPQYKNTGAAAAGVGNMPLSAAAVPSGLTGFGGSPISPGSHHLLLNPSGASVGSVSPYDDLLTAQYKEQQSHHYPGPPQQNESSMWLHGGGSRSPPGLSGGAAYYNLHQGPSQHGGAFRQSQQPSPYGGAGGYPGFYHSQGSVGGQQDHHLHGSADNRLGGGQGPQGPPSAGHQHQMWQHNY
ncbi:uncharacterized protein LOC144715354 isoform X2 [Wolffia australiana]